MKFLLSEGNPQKWQHCPPLELEDAKARLVDQDLAQLLAYGIGMHHAGKAYPPPGQDRANFRVSRPVRFGSQPRGAALRGSEDPGSDRYRHFGLGRQFPRSPSHCQG